MNTKSIVKHLNSRFPNRNWQEIVWRYENNEPIQTALKIAVERAIEEV